MHTLFKKPVFHPEANKRSKPKTSSHPSALPRFKWKGLPNFSILAAFRNNRGS
jgi:hypothetical protein